MSEESKTVPRAECRSLRKSERESKVRANAFQRLETYTDFKMPYTLDMDIGELYQMPPTGTTRVWVCFLTNSSNINAIEQVMIKSEYVDIQYRGNT